MDNSNLSNVIDVSRWNQELAYSLIPNTIVISLYLVFGIFGNTLVIAVYTFRMKKQSEDRYFVPILAVSDLCACIVCSSMTIALNQLQAEFTNNALCKVLWFFAATTTFMSVLLLTIIAIHRYLKVCRPFGRQLDLKWKRIVVGMAAILSILLGFPTSILYGSVEFTSSDGKLTGRRCSRLRDASKTGTFVYGSLVVLVLVAAITTLVFTYCRIGRKIYVHFKNMQNAGINKKSELRRPSDSGFSGKDTTDADTKSETCSSHIETSIDHVDDGHQSKNDTVDNTGHDKVDDKKQIRKPGSSRDNQKLMHKFSLMFLIIAVVFLICYVPKVILLVIEGVNSEFWENLSDNVRPGVLFVYRFYIFNNVVNPLVYAFLDNKFREETRSLVRCFGKRRNTYVNDH